MSLGIYRLGVAIGGALVLVAHATAAPVTSHEEAPASKPTPAYRTVIDVMTVKSGSLQPAAAIQTSARLPFRATLVRPELGHRDATDVSTENFSSESSSLTTPTIPTNVADAPLPNVTVSNSTATSIEVAAAAPKSIRESFSLDAMAAPEPGSLGILALASLFVLRRRPRKIA